MIIHVNEYRKYKCGLDSNVQYKKTEFMYTKHLLLLLLPVPRTLPLNNNCIIPLLVENAIRLSQDILGEESKHLLLPPLPFNNDSFVRRVKVTDRTEVWVFRKI